jgi:sugar phosphate isomerase/epimerase
MIDRVFASLDPIDLETGLRFALDHQLGYELPSAYVLENLPPGKAALAQYRSLSGERYGLLSILGPSADMNVVSPDPEIRKVSRQRYLQAIITAKELGVRYLIFPSQWSPAYSVIDGAAQIWLDDLSQYWETLIRENLQDGNLTILIENSLDPSPETMFALLQRVGSFHLRACLNTGRVNIFSTLSPIDWIRELGGYTAYIHANNNNGQIDARQAFDQGILDMPGFLNHLALLPQKVHLAINTSSLTALESSYEMTRPYLTLQHEQFVSKSFLI